MSESLQRKCTWSANVDYVAACPCSLAVTRSGEVYAWGSNRDGQLAADGGGKHDMPQLVMLLRSVGGADAAHRIVQVGSVCLRLLAHICF